MIQSPLLDMTFANDTAPDKLSVTLHTLQDTCLQK